MKDNLLRWSWRYAVVRAICRPTFGKLCYTVDIKRPGHFIVYSCYYKPMKCCIFVDGVAKDSTQLFPHMRRLFSI